MKRILKILFLGSMFMFIFTGCAKEKTTNTNINNITQNNVVEENMNKDDAENVNNIINDNINEENLINATVNIYEGKYSEESLFLYREDNTGFKYYEVEILKVNTNSFDFIISNVDFMTGEKNVVFMQNTAKFNGDGDTAIFTGSDYTLNFSFPNGRSSLPDVVQIKIDGLEIIEGMIFENNGVPKHEFS